ncbi:MAG TPA: hypothetical protein VGA16_08465 [Candidatus Limnocylindria bacterium]
MPTRIVADPEGGFPGKIEDGGTWVQGFYKMVAYAYGPGEIPPPDIDRATIAELRARYWDPTRRALVIPWRGGRTFEFGPKLLSQTNDATVVHVRPEFHMPTKDVPPKECFCGTKLR